MKAEKIVCDCGHFESPCSDVTRGYGEDASGKTWCLDCCLMRDKAALLTDTRTTHYLSGDGRFLTDWHGRQLGVVVRHGAVHPFSARGDRRRYITVRDLHGQTWHGTGAAGMWASLKKSKAARAASGSM